MMRNLALLCIPALMLSSSLSISLHGRAVAGEPVREPERPTRIDFDDRIIQGQTNTSGAVYLLERKEMPIHSMVRPRISFRHLTIRTVYDR